MGRFHRAGCADGVSLNERESYGEPLSKESVVVPEVSVARTRKYIYAIVQDLTFIRVNKENRGVRTLKFM